MHCTTRPIIYGQIEAHLIDTIWDRFLKIYKCKMVMHLLRRPSRTMMDGVDQFIDNQVHKEVRFQDKTRCIGQCRHLYKEANSLQAIHYGGQCLLLQILGCKSMNTSMDQVGLVLQVLPHKLILPKESGPTQWSHL
jgi:hypothetical protein